MAMLLLAAYAAMFGVLIWAYRRFRGVVARPSAFARTTLIGAIVTAVSFTLTMSENIIGEGCGAPALFAMAWPTAGPSLSAADAEYLNSCVSNSGLQVTAALGVQVVTLLIVAVFMSKQLGERRRPAQEATPMYPHLEENPSGGQHWPGDKHRKPGAGAQD